MNRIKALFDYQTIEKNSELEALIAETHSRYIPNVIELDDDSMEQVAAGKSSQVTKKNETDKYGNVKKE